MTIEQKFLILILLLVASAILNVLLFIIATAKGVEMETKPLSINQYTYANKEVVLTLDNNNKKELRIPLKIFQRIAGYVWEKAQVKGDM